MRLHRLRLANFRGVQEREVDFAATGVTVIEGPNEVGKSSLAEAINLLLDEPDSSGKARVKATKPVDVDAGPEAELEMSTGPYTLAYAKRWLSRPMTTLTVTAPRAQQLSGREAHDRMREILAETLDEDLWRALRYQQGESVAQAALDGCRSLSAALDAAATGGTPAGDDEDGLWGRIGEHWLQFFTSTGKPTVARTKLAERVAGLEADVAELAGELAALERTAEEYRVLGAEVERSALQIEEQEERLAEYEAALGAVRVRQERVAELALATQVAELAEAEASRSVEARAALRATLAAAADELAVLRRRDEGAAAGASAHAAAMAAAETALREAEAAAAAATAALALAAVDQEHCRNLLDREQLEERLGRVRAAEREQAAAQELLAGSLVDRGGALAVQQAVIALQEARARLEGRAVAVTVRALRDLTVATQGSVAALAAGAETSVDVQGQTHLSLEGIAEITVSAGGEQTELAAAAGDAAARLAELCAASGLDVENAVAQASEAVRRRESAQAAAKAAQDILAANLRDLTPEMMSEKIGRLTERIDAHLAARPAQTPLPAGLDQAKDASARAEAAAASASAALAGRRAALEQLAGSARESERAAMERAVAIQAAEGRLAACEKELGRAREVAADDALREAQRLSRVALAAAEEQHRAELAELAAENAGGAETLAGNAREVLGALVERAREMREERAALRRELDVRGESGLHDRLARAESELEHAARELESTTRRADAADLLRRLAAERRDAAQRSYAEPFRARLEEFARVVFGAGTELEVDHETLTVTSRTLDGRTVPYDSLSVGAREQICVLSRLACACLVEAGTGGEGAPLILDDALGNSDPQRLERLGAVLGTAGRQIQVIILTCEPDRYRNIGSGAVVRLGSAAAALHA